MHVSVVNPGFQGRRRQPGAGLIPPGQYVTEGFPVLTAGPTPRIATDDWDFQVKDPAGETVARWTWDEIRALPREQITVDIHCVTRWSKLATVWEGVSVDTLLDGLDTSPVYATAWADPDYTTNLPLADLADGKAWVVWDHDGAPLSAAHGGPARLLVPHLYFWKSAKWVRGLQLTDSNKPGYWESLGYHYYGDPWRQQRHWGD
jgi:DMSO/TMAO reductase YedYZ molybdopterin-dependent catalytic subunit